MPQVVLTRQGFPQAVVDAVGRLARQLLGGASGAGQAAATSQAALRAALERELSGLGSTASQDERELADLQERIRVHLNPKPPPPPTPPSPLGQDSCAELEASSGQGGSEAGGATPVPGDLDAAPHDSSSAAVATGVLEGGPEGGQGLVPGQGQEGAPLVACQEEEALDMQEASRLQAALQFRIEKKRLLGGLLAATAGT